MIHFATPEKGAYLGYPYALKTGGITEFKLFRS